MKILKSNEEVLQRAEAWLQFMLFLPSAGSVRAAFQIQVSRSFICSFPVQDCNICVETTVQLRFLFAERNKHSQYRAQTAAFLPAVQHKETLTDADNGHELRGEESLHIHAGCLSLWAPVKGNTKAAETC